jgi:DNA repair exonuclease SbcCD ATPase subunit
MRIGLFFMSETIPSPTINNDQNMHEAIVEVRAFVQNQTEEKAKAEAQARQDRWTRFAALSMAFIALVAGYTMSKGGDCASRMGKDLSEATYNQTQASDQWSFYQAKAQKQLLTELEINMRSLAKADEASLAELKKKIARYDKEKAEIKAEAEKFEKLRNTFRADAEAMAALGARLGKAAQTFQIALAIGGLCLLSKKKWLWLVTLGVAAVATCFLVLAFL